MTTIKIDAGVLDRVQEALNNAKRKLNDGSGTAYTGAPLAYLDLALTLLETAQPQPEVTADDSYRKILEDERSKLSSRVIELEAAIKDMWGDVDALLTRCVKYRKTNDRNLRLSAPTVQEVTVEEISIYDLCVFLWGGAGNVPGEKPRDESLAPVWSELETAIVGLAEKYPNGLRVVRGEGEK